MNRGGAWHPLVELTRVRLVEFLREPEAIFWAFVFPIVLSVALALAFPGGREQQVVVGVVTSGDSSELTAALSAAPGVTVRVLSPDDERRALRDGTVQIAVRPGDPPVYRYDATRSESRTARLVVDDALQRAAGRVDPLAARDDLVTIAGSRYVDWLIPGIVGMNIMGNSLWGLGFSIVQLRLRKILKRLVASPMRRWEFLAAQVVARLVFLLPEVAAPLLFGSLVFGMPIAGRLTDVAIVSLVGALGFSGLGLLLASRPRTFEAISGVMNLVMLPMWVLSGIFFSSANFPDGMQWFIHALPLTVLIDALRAVILEGSTAAGVWRELAVLAAWGSVPFALALRVFRWR